MQKQTYRKDHVADSIVHDLLQQIIVVRTVRIMAFRAGQAGCRFVSFPRRNLFPVMTVEAEFRRLGNKQKCLARSMRVVADAAASCGDWAMDILLSEIEEMTVYAKLLHGHDEISAP